jgi:uncharacterized protein YidB (DUF937 family)
MEETMGAFDDIVGSAVPKGSLAKPLILALGALLASGMLFKTGAPDDSAERKAATPPDDSEGGLLGGLGGLLNKFQQNGLGDQIDSWIGPGQNKPVAPRQVGSALGPDILKSLAQRSGLSEQELLAQLSQALPGVVDKLTPEGRLPTRQEAARFV